MYLNYHKANPNIIDPNYQTKMAACFDLSAYIPKEETIKIYSGKTFNEVKPEWDDKKQANFVALVPGERALIRTGLVFDIPENYSIRIHPRSGMALKYGLTLANAEGVVDEDYTYETKLIVLNTNQMDLIKIYDGDRIAQAEVVKYEQVQFAEIYNQPGLKTDRVGGFGSTGIS